jgi:hypothetical protein
MSAAIVEKTRSYSHAKKRTAKLPSMTSPKISLRSPEKFEKAKTTARGNEFFAAAETVNNDANGKSGNKTKIPPGYKTEFIQGQNSVFTNQTYRLDQNFVNHLQMLGMPVVQESEPNHSFTEILKIRAVNFATQDMFKKVSKPTEKPVIIQKKDEKKNKKKKKSNQSDILNESSFEKTFDESKEFPIDDSKSSTRKSLSNIKGKFDNPTIATNEDLPTDPEQRERKIRSATGVVDIKSTGRREREKDLTSESPSDNMPTKKNSEDSSSYSGMKKPSVSPTSKVEPNKLKSQTSNNRLGPLDPIKEAIPKKTTSVAASSNKANSNLIAAHKASAQNNMVSPYAGQSKVAQNYNLSPNNGQPGSSNIFQNASYLGNNTTPTQSINSINTNSFRITTTTNNTSNNFSNSLKQNSSNTNLTSSRNISPQVNRILNNKSVANPVQSSIAQSSTQTTSVIPSTNQSTVRSGISQSMVSPHPAALVSGSTAINQRPLNPNLYQAQEIKKKAVYVPPPVSNKFKYFIGGGNNKELVDKIMERRDWWEPTESFNTLFNFKWQQGQRGYRYERLIANNSFKQVVNHMENHVEISTKNRLIKNLSYHCEANKLPLFDMTPSTFLFDADDQVNFDTDIQKFAKFFIKHNPDQNKYPRPDPNGKNHNVWYNFDYRKKGNYTAPVMNASKKVSPYLKPKIHKTFITGYNVWILKPTGFNRGIGIEVFNTLESLNEFLNTFLDGSPSTDKKDQPKKIKKEAEGDSGSESEEEGDKKKFKFQTVKTRTFVIQKYIENLFVIKGRKFDIRVWSLVTQDMQLYFFKEGYLRTSCETFTLNNETIDNKFVHLTNNAVQKHADNYGQFENGNQLSFTDFDNYCKENNSDIDVRGKVIPRIKELITISMQSAKKVLNPLDRKYSFEIFGYDFMIDAEGNVWLIEVNTNPCIEESSTILQKLMPRMLDDAFKMTIDVLFPCPKKPNAKPTHNNIEKPIEKVVSQPVEGETEIQVDEEQKQNSPGLMLKKSPQKEEIHGGATTRSIEIEDSQPYKVDGYGDNESMWEYLCPLKMDKIEKTSPKKIGKQLTSNLTNKS